MQSWRIVCVSLALAGCSTTGTAQLKDLPADWPPLGTTKAAVESQLGPPSSQSVLLHEGQQREVWGWNYGHAELNPLLWVPVVGIFVSASGEGYRAEGKELTVTFNGEGKVVGRSISNKQYGSYGVPETDASSHPIYNGSDDRRVRGSAAAFADSATGP